MNILLILNIVYLAVYLVYMNMSIGFTKSISDTFYMLKDEYGMQGTIPYFITLALPAMTLSYCGYVYDNPIMIASGLFIFSVETFASFKHDAVKWGHYVGAMVGYCAMVVSFSFLNDYWWWSVVCGLFALACIKVKEKYRVIVLEVGLYILGIVGLLIYQNLML